MDGRLTGCYIGRMVKQALNRILNFIYPPVCGACKALLKPQNSSGVCLHCALSITEMQAPFCLTCGWQVAISNSKCKDCQRENFFYDRAFACARYEGKIKKLIQRYKFGEKSALTDFLSTLMLKFYEKHLISNNYDCLVAVPLAASTWNKRGFNQSCLLSKKILSRYRIPDYSQFLKCTSKSPQSRLTKKQRALNIQNRFQCSDNSVFQDKSVLLLDDILTTGRTASECARILRLNGATSVHVLVLARGIKQ